MSKMTFGGQNGKKKIRSIDLDESGTAALDSLIQRFESETTAVSDSTLKHLGKAMHLIFRLLVNHSKNGTSGRETATATLEHYDNCISASISFKRSLGFITEDVFEQHTHQRVIHRERIDAEWLNKAGSEIDRILLRSEWSHYVIEFVQYEHAPNKDSSSWYLAESPSLAKGVSLEAQSDSKDVDHPSGIIREDSAEDILQLDPIGFYAASQLDGKQSLQDIYMSCIGIFGLVAPETIRSLYEQLEAMGYLDTVRSKAYGISRKKTLAEAYNLNASIPDADGIVSGFHGIARRSINWFGVIILLATGTSGIYPLFKSWDKLSKIYYLDFHGFQAFASSIFAAYLFLIASVILHELGHGIVCKHYGGKIHRLGLTFYLGNLMFYCDTTSSWKFPNKFDRIKVSLGGPLVSYTLLGFSLWMFWFSTNPFWVGVWYIFAFISIIALIMNFNPFIRMDAYYMLMDWLEVPNLRPRSFAYLKEVAGKFFGSRKHVEADRSSPREKRIFWFYGILGVIMTVALVGWAIDYYVRSLLREDWLHAHIYLVLVFLVLTLTSLAYDLVSQVYSSRNAEIILK